MIRNLLAAVFLVALLVWCWLEFSVPSADDGIKNILFWVGMLAVLFTAYDRRRSDVQTLDSGAAARDASPMRAWRNW